jgi:type IV secretory pathway TrbD component
MQFNAKLGWEHRRESFFLNYRTLTLGIAFTAGCSVLGLFLTGWIGALVGLVLGLAAIWLLPSWRTKVIEKTRGHAE